MSEQPVVIPGPITPGPAEIKIMRRNTLAFILADPVRLTLSYRAKTPTNDGGFSWGSPQDRTEQTFRLIAQSDVMPQVQTPDGFQLTPTYVLLGAHDCEMGRWDKFTLNGVDFQIVSPVRPDFKKMMDYVYERKADVARL